MKSVTPKFSAQIRSNDRPRDISASITELELDLTDHHLTPSKRNECLEQLKACTQTPPSAKPLCNKQSIILLGRHAFGTDSATTARTAIKCLANLMLLAPETRQFFVDVGLPQKAAELLKVDNREDEFLASRVLFLTTYDTKIDFNKLFSEHQLADTININIARHAKQFKNDRRRASSVGDALGTGYRSGDTAALEGQAQLSVNALSETLKLLFNLTQFYPSQVASLSSSLIPILKLLSRIKLTSPPLQAPITYLINALLNLTIDDAYLSKGSLFPTFDAKCNVDRLVLILDLSLRQCKDDELEKTANPLMTLLRRIYEVAPMTIQAQMRSTILPSAADRAQPLGKGDSMSARMLRLSSSPAAPKLHESVQSLLFEMSGHDVTRFIQNIGYGFASGFLMTHNMSVPESGLQAWSSHDDDANTTAGNEMGARGGSDQAEQVEVNPITGQRRDMEESDEEDLRSDEDKEREAERLFVLFERLRATGVVNVENPVRTAVEQGRFEELE